MPVAALPRVESLDGLPVSERFAAAVPGEFARRNRIVAVEAEGVTLLAVAEDGELGPAEHAARRMGGPVRLVRSAGEQVEAALARLGSGGVARAAAGVDVAGRAEALEELRALARREDLLDGAGRAPVVKLVNLLLAEAIESRASDVHLQPEEDALVARLRIDGVLHEAAKLPKAAQEEVVSRVKVMAKMDIAEKRLPQDGRIAVEIGRRQVDLRISTLPTDLGERVVIRLLDKSRGLLALDQLGMPADTAEAFRRLVGTEHGILLTTGPTGSGKTTTLYASLGLIDHDRRNVLTIEDPIEYQLAGISQTQVNVRKGMTFASGLRSLLRQDPDVIMVGEIRDRETAEIAIQAALTGHLVLSTLHTNDAAGAVTRLLELGVEPFLVASSVVGVLAQRLLRRVCPHCAAADDDVSDLLAVAPELAGRLHDADRSAMRRGVGCAKCRQTGHLGRTGVYELLPLSGELLALVRDRADADTLKAAALREGMTTLREAAIRRMLAGETTPQEVVRLQGRA